MDTILIRLGALLGLIFSIFLMIFFKSSFHLVLMSAFGASFLSFVVMRSFGEKMISNLIYTLNTFLDIGIVFVALKTIYDSGAILGRGEKTLFFLLLGKVILLVVFMILFYFLKNKTVVLDKIFEKVDNCLNTFSKGLEKYIDEKILNKGVQLSSDMITDLSKLKNVCEIKSSGKYVTVSFVLIIGLTFLIFINL